MNEQLARNMISLGALIGLAIAEGIKTDVIFTTEELNTLNTIIDDIPIPDSDEDDGRENTVLLKRMIREAAEPFGIQAEVIA
ncbi:hypothetical protein [Paenibacillus agricola]|uniref:Uncharacterized protein n=1 Tax=Paenibacillus agricola TaxID=2716264 RepID=A0ABX0J451_9BACL|nr:hypothetical protein [Paenibacillus agricola]NHN31162.1 hypothetical protein [Paenibacillus agricola]